MLVSNQTRSRRRNQNYAMYRPSHHARTSYYQPSETKQKKLFPIKVLIASCLFVSILVIEQSSLKNVPVYQEIKSYFLGAFSYGPVTKLYEEWFGGAVFVGYLPQEDVDKGASIGAMGTINEVEQNIVLDNYENGVIIKADKGEPILSLFSGYVHWKETDETLDQFIKIQLADESILTVGFLDNCSVGLYHHVHENQPLGTGVLIDGHTYYYLALEKEGKYLKMDEVLAYLNDLES